MSSSIESVQTQRKSKELAFSFSIFRRNKLVLSGSIIAAGSLVLALLSNLLVNPVSWRTQDLGLRLCWNNPWIKWGISGVQQCPVSSVFPLGTDAYGRNLLNMIILALPTDLQVSFEIVISSILLGLLIGGVAALTGGILDEVLMRMTDVFFSIPALILALVLLTDLGRSLLILTVALTLTWWPYYARLARSQFIGEIHKPYVEALRSVGVGQFQISLKHILPNSIYPLLVSASLDVGGVILVFSSLMFLGFSPNPLLPELGNLINSGIDDAFTAPWVVLFPGLVILLISLGFNLLGDGLRDLLDPRLRR